jgi:DNA adenine methylase
MSSPQLPRAPKPFLKWAGGKSQLLNQFTALYPKTFNGYHEPFVGSAAVYFHLYGLKASGRLEGALHPVRLTDSNDELINCYQVVRDPTGTFSQLDALVAILGEHRRNHSSEHYYSVRALPPGELTKVARAARLIYLNKTCYNGLYRVNHRGQFNVPMGSYKNPRIFDADELACASQALQQVEIAVADFHEVVEQSRPGDLVYLDPPYFPLTPTASFTSYTENAFGESEQRELAQVFRDLDRKGCLVMLSNSWTPFILNLYQDYRCVEVQATRAINSKAERRGVISELVVLNYDPP